VRDSSAAGAACGRSATAGRDIELPGREPAQAGAEIAFQAVEPVDQRSRQFVQGLALARQVQAPAMAFEQRDAQFALQRAQLQTDGRLAEKDGFGRARHRTQASDVAEGTQLLEAAAFVVEAGGFGGHRSRVGSGTVAIDINKSNGWH
jgi:hypothetical protein